MIYPQTNQDFVMAMTAPKVGGSSYNLVNPNQVDSTSSQR